jgi:hypothetical protein
VNLALRSDSLWSVDGSIPFNVRKTPKGDSEAAWSLENGGAPGYYAAGFNNIPVRGRVM